MLIVQLMWDCTIAFVPARIGLRELLAEADSVAKWRLRTSNFSLRSDSVKLY